MLKEKDPARAHLLSNANLHAKNSSDEEGEINEKKPAKQEPIDFAFEGIPSISNLGDHIRPLTLTRNFIVDLLNSRRFEELVKGCFVRYLIDSNVSTNSNSYIIAQIVGVDEGNREYTVNNVKTKVLLKLQETSENVVTLSLQLISNQHPPGGLEIEKWLQTNRTKIPKEKDLKEKLEQHNKLLVEQLSSTEIDTNIWKKARKIAEDQEEPKEDITHLIDFVSEKLHNLEVQIEEEEIGRKTTKLDVGALRAERDASAAILDRLRQVRERFIRARPVERRAEQAKREKKYSWSAAEEKRKDEIAEKCKARYIMLSTFEGWNKLKNQIIDSHHTHAFDFA